MLPMNQLERVERAALPPSRSVRYMLEAYGGEGTTLPDFVNTYAPVGSVGIDVGAGRSIFGNHVNDYYRNLAWTNFDIQYNDKNLVYKLRQNPVGRVNYMYGDILAEPGEKTSYPESWENYFKLVCSWNLLGLFLRIDEVGRQLGEQALRNILKLSSPHGRVMVGPVQSKTSDAIQHVGKSIHLKAYADEATVDAALDALTIPPRKR